MMSMQEEYEKWRGGGEHGRGGQKKKKRPFISHVDVAQRLASLCHL